MHVPAITIARTRLAAAGFDQLAGDITGGADTVVRPARALTAPEAEALVRIRRQAYLAVGLHPCNCDGEVCPNLDADGQPMCFEDDEEHYARQLRSLQQPAPERLY